MTARYLLLHGTADPEEIERIAASVRDVLPKRWHAPGTLLFTSADCPVIALPAIEGWIIGSLFSSDGANPCHAIGPASQLAIMSSGGRTLITGWSGAYVAIWRACDDGALVAVRDPSGCLPCYSARIGPSLAVASSVAFLADAGLVTPLPDSEGVATSLRYAFVPDERTALLGIEEVPPGSRSDFGKTSRATAVWDPTAFAKDHVPDVQLIASAIDAVVHGQCIGQDRIALELSGGLDSSIVAAALARTDTRRFGVHMVPAAADGDERRFANLIMARTGFEAMDVPITVEDFDVMATPDRLTARPTGFHHMQAIDRKLRTASLGAEAEMVFSGAGGDSVFCSLRSTAPLIDAWHDGGWKQALATLNDLAEVIEVSHWNLLRHLGQRLARPPFRGWRWPADNLLLNPAFSVRAPLCAAGIETLPPGARAHLVGLQRVQNILHAHDRFETVRTSFPLMAQPVIEACLAVPSWRWFSGGRDRAAAREAFAGRVPDEILQRRGKGRLDTLMLQDYERKKPALRALLLDGWIAGQRIIDREAVDRALNAPSGRLSTVYGRLIQLAGAELWCRAVLGWKREPRTVGKGAPA